MPSGRGLRSRVAAKLRAESSVLLMVGLFVAACISGCSGFTTAKNSAPPTLGTISATPTTLNFGNVAIGSNSSQTFTLTNPSTTSVTVSQATISSSSYKLVNVSLPMTVAAGQSVTASIEFVPQTTGSIGATLSVVSTASNATISIALAGTGVQGQLVASPASVSFGSVLVGGNSAQTVTLSNTGSVSLTISQASVSGAGFTLSGLTLPLTLNAGSNSTFHVTFAPTVSGNASGSTAITSNASNPSLSINLSGTGIQPQISATPSSVSFGSVATGSTSTQTIRLSNPGTANLTITQAAVSGAGFSISGLTVPLTIAPGNSATFDAAFAPASVGSVTGSVALTSNAPNSPMSISLSGSGVAASALLTANPTSVNFGNIQVGNTGTQNVTLTNTGNATVTISQVTVSGSGFAATGVTATQTLTVGQSLTMTVTFTPNTTGNASGTVSIASNATNSPTVVSLTGGSHLVDLSWTASTTSTVVGYNIYRGTTNNGPYSLKLNSTPVPGVTFTDTNVQSSLTYYYVVTAVDSSGVESVYSNQASATIP